MTKTSPQICTPIKFRTDERKIYWRESTDTDSDKRQRSVSWGKLPTERLEKFLALLNEPTINNRKKICRQVGLSSLPKDKLRDSGFVKKEIFERFKFRQLHGRGCFKPSRLTPEQTAKIEAIMEKGISLIKEGVNKQRTGCIKAANALRESGMAWTTITGHERFLMRDYDKFQSLLPAQQAPAFLRLAMSVWRNYPNEIFDYRVAEAIMKHHTELDGNAKIYCF